MKEDISDHEQHIKDLVDVGGVGQGGAVVAPPSPLRYTISNISIMQY